MNTASYPDLRDSAVFITGGGSGIGAAFVRAFCRAGARVAFVSLDASKALSLCADVEAETGVAPLFQRCDINDVEHLQQCIADAAEKIGDIRILINNAARDTRHTLQGMDVTGWDESLNTNLRPHFFTAQKVSPGMRALGGGSIINVGSNSAMLGHAGYPAYVTAKAGIVGLTKALARELGADNIRVNALVPGWVMTERQKQLWVTEEALQECLEQQCLKDTIAEQDIADAALFLASSAARMITAQALVVDGGRA